MSVETRSDLNTPSINEPAAPGRPVNRRRSRRWLSRGIFLVALAGILGVAYSMLPDRRGSNQQGERMTYTVKRGNLIVTVTEKGTLESSENTEIKCKVRGQNTVISVVESGTYVESGQELVRLDTLQIEEAINERTKYAHWSRSGSENSKAQVASAKLAINEYLEGRFPAAKMTLEKDLAIAESNLRAAQNMLDHAERMASRGYVSQLQVDRKEFAVTQAELAVQGKKTDIEVLVNFTKKEQLETLNGNLKSVSATHEANVERAYADAHRRDRALEEFKLCTIKAPRDGLVIYPSAAAWKDAPDIAEGATVHKDQILLLMPDLSQMQVKVGIHESIVDRVGTGLVTNVALADRALEATVSSVASVASPSGWWTGNVVKYDTIIKLPSVEGLKPGMSAEVQIVLAEYEDVLTVPVAAVVETEEGTFCWIETDDGPERREVSVGDSNDIHIIIEDGVDEGDEVILNPIAFVEEAQDEVLKQENTNDAPDEDDGKTRSNSAALPAKKE